MSSQPETNRANSLHSTGPRTEAGKQVSSLNALRHGLTSQIVVIPGEDLAAYQRHAKSFFVEYDPKGPTEAHLVKSLADVSWRLNRVAVLEANILTDDTPYERQVKAIATLGMHSQRLSRQFERTVTQLRELQETRISEEEHQLDDLIDIIKMHESKGKRYNPSADGFVFSEAQIQAARQARTRENLALKAVSYRRAA